MAISFWSNWFGSTKKAKAEAAEKEPTNETTQSKPAEEHITANNRILRGVKRCSEWFKKATLSSSENANGEFKAPSVALDASGKPVKVSSAGGSEMDAILMALQKLKDEKAKTKESKRNMEVRTPEIDELIKQIESCRSIRYRFDDVIDRLMNNLHILSKSIPEHVVNEIKLCCDFMQSGEIKQTANSQASTWLRWTPIKPELDKIMVLGLEKYREQATTPIAGELVGGYLKKLIQSVEGGVILKPFCDLLMALFEDTPDSENLRISVDSKPLIRAILNSNSQRHQILQSVSSLAQYIVKENGVQPKSLAVVFAVHDLQADIVTLDPRALEDVAQRMKVKKDFERWNAAIAALMLINQPIAMPLAAEGCEDTVVETFDETTRVVVVMVAVTNGAVVDDTDVLVEERDPNVVPGEVSVVVPAEEEVALGLGPSLDGSVEALGDRSGNVFKSSSSLGAKGLVGAITTSAH
ncbi:hypothetical protein HDU67_006255 [Dinochytrium kinnereticum]|nr:hypothetical protein HDU67_006255 [Dinochytrium kinnereticum]